MTDDDWRELGQRAVACRGWRWMPGMRAIQDRGGGAEPVRLGATDEAGDEWPHPEAWPDLRDPATLGCLTALVREAWDEPASVAGRAEVFECDPMQAAWMVFPGDRHPLPGHRILGRGETEAEALVAALERAP